VRVWERPKVVWPLHAAQADKARVAHPFRVLAIASSRSRTLFQQRKKRLFQRSAETNTRDESLQCAYDTCIMIWMRTTLNIDDELLAEARKFTGEKEKTALVHLGLRALIEREAGKRLARLGATMPKLRIAPRRR
jgi:Arc/MetJ family transcription regulator